MFEQLITAIQENDFTKVKFLITLYPNLLNEVGIDTKVKNHFFTEKYTPLHWAIKYERIEIIDLLINLKPALIFESSIGRSGKTPLYLAVKCNNLEVIKTLVNRSWALLDQEGTKKAINLAANENNNEIVDFFLEKEPSLLNQELFLSAIKNGNYNRLEFLLNLYHNVIGTKSELEGTNILIYTINHGPSQFCSSNIMKSKKDNVDDINLEIEYERLDCKARCVEAVKLMEVILKFQPELISKVDVQGRTTLHYSAQQAPVKILEFLLHHISDLAELLDKDGNSILHYAAKNSHHCTEVMLFLVNKFPHLIEKVNNKGDTVLHTLVNNNYIFEQEKAIELLYKINSDLINRVNKKNETVTQIAAKGASAEVTELLIKYELLNGQFEQGFKTKLQLSCWYNSDDPDGETIYELGTALEWAASRDKNELVELLISSINYEVLNDFKNKKQNTLSSIFAYCKVNTIKLFLEYGGGGDRDITYIDLLFLDSSARKSANNLINNEELLRLITIINYRILSKEDIESLKHRYNSITLGKISEHKKSITDIQYVITKIINKVNSIKENLDPNLEKDSPILSLTFLAAHKLASMDEGYLASNIHNSIEESVTIMKQFISGINIKDQSFIRNEIKKLLTGLEVDLMPLSLKEEEDEDLSDSEPYFTVNYDSYVTPLMQEITGNKEYSYSRKQPTLIGLYEQLKNREVPIQFTEIEIDLSGDDEEIID